MQKLIVVAGITAACIAAVGCGGSGKTDTAAAPEVKRTMDSTVVTAESVRVERFRIFSPSMQRNIRVAVVLPPEYDAHPDKKYPVLYTLHGHAAPWDTWANMPLLRKELKDKPFIYTCFDGDIGSGYMDAYYPIKTSRDRTDTTKHISKFKTFFFDEFVPAIDGWYRIDADKRGITGFSMGGRGAFGYMLARPDMFCSVSGLSAAFVEVPSDTGGRGARHLERMLGSRKEYPERYEGVDQYERLKKLVNAGVKLPPIFQECGTEDRLIERPRKMAAFAKELGLTDYTYVETAGAHNWKYWHPASVRIADFHWKHFNN